MIFPISVIGSLLGRWWFWRMENLFQVKYRRFKIRSVEGQNDFAMMQEVITRRFRRALADDEKFNKLPDLMLIDGGKGQLSAAQTAMKAFAVISSPGYSDDCACEAN